MPQRMEACTNDRLPLHTRIYMMHATQNTPGNTLTQHETQINHALKRIEPAETQLRKQTEMFTNGMNTSKTDVLLGSIVKLV